MKNWLRSGISLLLAAAMILGFAPRARAVAPDLTDGLLAHYDFETVSGTTVTNAANAATFPGTLSGSAAVTDLDGSNKLGSSLQLTSAQDGMQLTNIVNASTSSFSVSMWYKLSGSSSVNVNLFQAGTIGGDTGRTILILSPDSKYYTYVTGDNAKVTTASPVDRTQWQNIIFAYDREANKAYYYVNGVADNAAGVTLSGSPLDTADMIIGRHRNVEGPLNGLVDEVRIYNKVLSAADAKAIFATTNTILKDTEPEPPEQPQTITLTVDVNDPQRMIDSDSIFGINHRYAFNGYGSFDSQTMQMKEDFVALYEDAGFGSIRYPGGTISNLFNWKTSIGPVAQRKNQIHGFYNNAGQGGIAPNFGLTEIGTFAESVGSEMVYVYSLGRGNAQDAADLIEYLNAKVGTNPNGGIDWAAVRAANGHEAPYGVRYFEIGNEMQQAWGGSDGTASQGYWTTNVSAGAETAYIDGGIATFNRQYAVCEEDWNQVASRSDGSANLVRYMRYANVNPKMYDANNKVVDDPDFVAVNKDSVAVFVDNTQWTIVDSLATSGAADQHVTVDYSTGAIRFGDGTHGAIPASGSQIYVSYSVDRDGFIDVSKAIKNTMAKINEIEGTSGEAHVYSSFETAGFISKMDDRNANQWYDGLTIHPYSGTPDGTGEAFYDSAMKKAEDVGIQNVQNYVNMMPADKVPVISEYGIFRSTDPLVRSQTHAIYIAKVLMEYVRLGSPYIQKHCLIDWYSSGADSLGPTQQAVIQAVAGADADTKTGEGTFTFFSTPSAHVFKMLNTAFGDTIVSTEFSSVPTMSNGAKELSALASTDDDGTLHIAIVNAKRNGSNTVKLDLQNLPTGNATFSIQYLAANSYDTANTPEDPDAVSIVQTSFTTVLDSSHIPLTIPAHGFIILTIDPEAEVSTEPVVGSFEADITELPTRGGEVSVTVRGRNLPDGIRIRCGDNIVTTSGNAIAQTAVLTFPANTTRENQVYSLSYSLDGETFTGELSVTVFVDRYDPDDPIKDIPVADMTVYAENYQPNNSTEGNPDYVLDNDPGTHWHTVWQDSQRDTHYLIFTFDEVTEIDGMRFLQRAGGPNGVVTKYDLLVREDENGEWETVIDDGTLEATTAWQIVNFDAVNAKQVKFQVVEATSDNSQKFGAAAEIRFTSPSSAEVPEETTPDPTTPDPSEPQDTKPVDTTPTEPEDTKPEVSEPDVSEPDASEPDASEPDASEPDASEPDASEPEYTVPECDKDDNCVLSQFDDIVATEWYHDGIHFCVEEGIMNGMGEGKFAPNENTTRAQLVMMLYRLAGAPDIEGKTEPFSDVSDTDWFYAPIVWAYENKVVNGVSDTEFAPNAGVTREQVATILHRYLGEPEGTGKLDAFPDVADVSEYAVAPLTWAVGEGLITGIAQADGTALLAPTGNATRAQIATILMRHLTK